MIRIYPQLSREDAFAELFDLENMLKAGQPLMPFANGTIHPKSIFRGSGGTPADLHHLRALHDGLETKISQIGGSGRAWDRAFDVVTGSFLMDWFAEDRNQASNPEVWPYLTILVLPDLAVQRFGLKPDGTLPKERYLSGRRNVFYRTYLRASSLGPLLEDPDLPLFEDDLVGLMDRTLSADRRIATLVGEKIQSIPRGDSRRQAVRNGLKVLQYELRVTDLSSLNESDARHAVNRAFSADR
ncbi:hypothetical protein [Brevibacterium sp. UCMA 11752]|uniref:hypothetical protein n=1 Tax=Brevibacterium sp. UCMA 11752 TaxID=2745946 RepID=UPI001F3121AC|nr:hypothetical protein [Brevibacterium sp. UCMA 11752]MCF2586107.1 hypothetical protein [Brevibacterium sp. UCMA 11752]